MQIIRLIISLFPLLLNITPASAATSISSLSTPFESVLASFVFQMDKKECYTSSQGVEVSIYASRNPADRRFLVMDIDWNLIPLLNTITEGDLTEAAYEYADEQGIQIKRGHTERYFYNGICGYAFEVMPSHL